MWKFWIIAAGIFLILESITTGFLVFWFSIGSLFALVTSFITDSIIAQATVFIISSTILIFATRKLSNKFLKNDAPSEVNTIIGKEGKVTVTIDSLEGTGQIKVGSETWSALSENNKIINKDTKVLVQSINGVKAVVTPVDYTK